MDIKVKKIFAAIVIATSIASASAYIPAYCQSASDTASAASTTYTQYPGTNIYYARDVAPTTYNAVVAAYVNLPDNVKTTLVADGITIRLSNDTTGRWSRSSGKNKLSVAGLYHAPNYGVVQQTGDIVLYDNGYIELSGYTNSENAMWAVSHEVGHAIDSTCLGGVVVNKHRNIASSTDTWAAICKTEGATLIKASGHQNALVSSTKELFAEAAALYFMNPTAMAKSCPQMYNYVNNILTTY